MLRSLFGLGRTKTPEPAHDFPRSDLCVIAEFAAAEFVDVEGLAEELGIEVGRHPYRPELCGTLQRFGRRWMIGVNAADAFTRQRFTIAHEIGHYVMHRDLVAMRDGIPGIGDDRSYRQPDIDAIRNPHITIDHERQATQIAIRILMERDKMIAFVEEGLSDAAIGMLIGCSAGAVGVYRGTLRRKA